jgi:large subunit ribosomal protein L25
MEQIQLTGSIRETRGKKFAKQMRAAGQIPAVVYHRGDESVAISVSNKEISKILHAHAGENILINLTIEKAKKKTRAVIIKEVQQDPVKRFILHVDFNEISLSERIIIDVEVITKGESIGVKREGGLLEHVLREIKISCLPTDIPKHIEVDISGLKVGDTIHVRDISVSDKVKILTDPDTLLIQVRVPIEEKTAEEGVVAPEIEVIREKKEEEGAAAPGKEEGKAKEGAKAEKK